MVGHAGSPICIAHADADPRSRSRSLTLSIFVNLQFSTSISSAIFLWSSKLMVDYDSMGPVYSYSEPDFGISAPVGGHVTSKFVKC